MRAHLALAALLTGALVIPAAAAAAPGHPSTGTLKCRTQIFSYTRGANHVLNSSKGPRTRSDSGQGPTLTDNRVLAEYQPVTGAMFLNIASDYYTATDYTRLVKVTVYPVKGKHKSWNIGENSNKDFSYKYDLLKDHGQVQLPVSGSNGQGRATPKLKKVVVKAREDCFTTQ